MTLLARVPCLLVMIFASLSYGLEVPPLRGHMNDLAGLLPQERAQFLGQRLATFERDTGHQLAVLTIPSLDGEALEDFSIKVAEQWKIGRKGSDTGVLLLIVQKERRIRMEVGYGLEGVLPDAVSNRIINQLIAPRFSANDYAGGVEAGIDAIINVAKGEPLPPAARPSQGILEGDAGWVFLRCLGVAVIVALFVGLVKGNVFAPLLVGAATGAVSINYHRAEFGDNLSVVFGVIVLLGAFLGALCGLLGGLTHRRFKRGQKTGDAAAVGNSQARSEALFKSMFPDLQPHFHPRNLVAYVTARCQRSKRDSERRWDRPAGFKAAYAEFAKAGQRERVRLFDDAKKLVIEFDYETQPTGAVIRLGKGKFTVDLAKPKAPKVRYWHPDREFKWDGEGRWKFTTPIADRPIESANDRTRSSTDSRSSSSSSSTATAAATAAAAAVLVGAGGAFGGGGSSSSWDQGSSATPDSSDTTGTSGGGTTY